jgi:hypothetical protein
MIRFAIKAVLLLVLLTVTTCAGAVGFFIATPVEKRWVSYPVDENGERLPPLGVPLNEPDKPDDRP